MSFPMRNLYLMSLLVVGAVLAAGCSSTQSYFLDPEYQENKTKAPVGILMIEKEQFPEVYTHTFSSLRSREARTVRLFLEPLYSTAAETEAWLVPDETIANPQSFESRRFTVETDSFHVMVPESRRALSFSGRSPRYLLILDQYHYQQVAESSSESSYAGHEASITQVLVFETRYVYWDVTQEQVVGYGTARSQMNLEAEEPTVSEYSDVLSESLKQIARWGPIITPRR